MPSPIAYPTFLGPSEVTSLDRAFARIAEALLSGRADFLFGAGMSRDAQVPTGCELSLKLLNLFFPPTADDPPPKDKLGELVTTFPFEALVEAVQETRGKKREDLTKDLKGMLVDPFVNLVNSTLPQSHRDFLSICSLCIERPLERIFTTNFDPVLEIALGARGVRVTEQTAHKVNEARRNGQIALIYLHGTLDGDDEYQVTESDVFDASDEALKQDFSGALNQADAFVFVGYSMNDPDFRALYMHYRTEIKVRKKTDKRTYVVSPAKDKFAYALGKQIWDNRGADWIPLDAATFFAKLKYVLEREYDTKHRQAIMKKRHLQDEGALDQLITRTAEILRVDHADAQLFLLEARPRAGGKQ